MRQTLRGGVWFRGGGGVVDVVNVVGSGLLFCGGTGVLVAPASDVDDNEDGNDGLF